MIALFKIAILLIVISCGNSNYVEYPNITKPDDLRLKAKCPIFLDSYKRTIMPIVENKCMECHSVSSQPSLGFIASDHVNNAKKFQNLYDGNLSKLLSKLNNEIPHKGLDAINSADEKNINLFFEVKKICDNY